MKNYISMDYKTEPPLISPFTKYRFGDSRLGLSIGALNQKTKENAGYDVYKHN